MKLIIRWAIIALSLFAAVQLVSGITVGSGGWTVFVAMAVVFGLVNALVRPILTLFSLPLIVLTLGLFSLVVNALAFWLSSALAQSLGIAFVVDGFVPALLGSIVVSVVSTILNVVLIEEG